MKRKAIIIMFFVLLISQSLLAESGMITTENGLKVKLNPKGNWEYVINWNMSKQELIDILGEPKMFGEVNNSSSISFLGSKSEAVISSNSSLDDQKNYTLLVYNANWTGLDALVYYYFDKEYLVSMNYFLEKKYFENIGSYNVVHDILLNYLSKCRY